MTEPIKLSKEVIEGITDPVLKKLMDAGITTIQALSMQNPQSLAEAADVGEDTAEKYIKKARKLIDIGFITATQLKDQRSNRTHLKTGCEEFDALLGGGFESETTSEIIGDGAMGKTQICHALAVLAQQPLESGGLGGNVAWIDTEDTFRPERIEEICSARGLDPIVTMENIHWALAKNSDHQKELIIQLFSAVPQFNIKLVIVDSMIGHLRGEYLGRGTLNARQNMLGSMLQTLMRLAQSMKVTIIYTNQVLDNPGVMYGDPTKAAGGHIMSHSAGTRLQLRKGREGARVVKLIDSLSLPEGEAVFYITAKGIEGKPKKKEETKSE